MIEILETMPDIELALLIIGVFALILGIVLGYAMIHEYKMHRLSGNLVGISINLCKSIQKELFINDTP